MSNNRNKVFYKIVSISQSIGIRLLLNFGLFFVLAKQLDIDAFVDVSFCLSLSSLLLIISEFGQRNSLLVNGVNNTQKKFCSALKIFSYNSVVSSVIYLLIVYFYLDISLTFAMVILLYNITLSICELVSIYARLIDRHKDDLKYNYINVFLTSIVLIVSLTFKQAEFTVFYMVFIRVLLMASFVNAINLNFSFSSEKYTLLIKREYSYALDSIASSVYGPVEMTFSRAFLPATHYAVFQVSQKLCQASFVLIQSLSNVYIPEIARKNKLDFSYIFLSLVIGTTCATFFYFFCEMLVELVIGEQVSVGDVNLYVSAYILIRYLAAAFGGHVLAFGMKKARVIASIILITNYLLIIAFFTPTSTLEALKVSAFVFLVAAIIYIIYLVCYEAYIQGKKTN